MDLHHPDRVQGKRVVLAEEGDHHLMFHSPFLPVPQWLVLVLLPAPLLPFDRELFIGASRLKKYLVVSLPNGIIKKSMKHIRLAGMINMDSQWQKN